MGTIRYISTSKYAEMMGKSKPAVLMMIKQGRIPGVVQVMVHNRPAWAIPENAPWPQTSKGMWDNIDLTALVEAKYARKKPGPKPKPKP